MNGSDLSGILLQELDYKESPGLISSIIWANERPIPDINAVYSVQNVPIAYFSQLSYNDPEHICKLYRHIWSQSKVPLLYVVLPQEIHVYNVYADPPRSSEELSTEKRLLQILQQLTDVESARQKIRTQLSWYNRLSLETGAFWNTPDGQKIKREKRADQRLLNGMDQVRRYLINLNLSPDQAYALLGRSIFIRYLEDRGILTSDLMLQLTRGGAENYRNALDNIDITYRLFEGLSQRFNGDLFPPRDERHLIEEKHLDILRKFLDGYDFVTGQLSFWPYDFTYIPIELISGIYDTFLYSASSSERRRRALGAYYTPLSLVDFVVEETLPIETIHPNMKVLDPACGSGVFLVRAYQRLIEVWKRENRKHPTVQNLSAILKNNIFGVDIEVNAIQIAAFSLYLTMLDHLKNEEILKEEFRFPSLKGQNLITADFFSKRIEELFSEIKFDRIIGNLPWGKGTLKGDALQRVEEEGYQIGGKQIVQVFLQYAPKFCSADGELALLAPAKSTILVTSNTHEDFRQKFFEKHCVRAVVNFSALVYELFVDSLSPVVALFYHSGSSSEHAKLVYGVPKPSPLSQRLGAIILDATEVKYLDREQLLSFPVLWKVASWGTPRDAILIDRLKALPTLRELEKSNVLRGEIKQGFTAEHPGSDKNEALWLQGKPLLDTDKFTSYVAIANDTVQGAAFHRPRSQEIYVGPLALIRRSTCEAAFFEGDFIAYRDKVTGVLGQPGSEYLLKWLVAYINSPLARYYHFLTSTSWAVERGTIIHEEYKDMPFILPSEGDSRLKAILELFEQIVDIRTKSFDKALIMDPTSIIREKEQHIADLIYEIFDLNEAERQLVKDVVNYEIDFFNWAKRKQRTLNSSRHRAVRRPDSDMLAEYAHTFIEVAVSLLRYQGQTLNAVAYQNGAPLSIVGFELTSALNTKDVELIESSSGLRAILRKLDSLLLEQQTSTLYMRRHVRVYDGSWLYLVRPSEGRFWTCSQARADADSFLSELLSQSRKDAGVSH